ncbi:NAD(P)H-binding protein [Chitinophaga sp. 212800010-3]|uniref:NAD(P)H-binding protein n=1 Tax=unclassified Chitinophaga TaxID=2619133 RepID=UPI002DEF346E|nr:NAD-dependent dehydratase [Chitinophaga sp. 212800010-3]
MKQTILGAGGAIGIELAAELSGYTKDIRLVGRNPRQVNPSDEVFKADLSDRWQVFKAIEGSSIVYLTVGFEYNIAIWQVQWPLLIRNVIDACLEYGAKLVFFDNVYAIGGDNVKHITEESPFSPVSKKGEVRMQVDQTILDSIGNRNLEAIIARAPDFFSDIKGKSLTMNLIYDNLLNDKEAAWLCNAEVIHSVGYTPELAKGTAILGNTNDAYGQIWNLPTDPQPVTGAEWIRLFAAEMGKSDKFQLLSADTIKELGAADQILKEIYEMLYQYDRDYYFDSSKFNKRFNYTPLTNALAVKQTVERLAQ